MMLIKDSITWYLFNIFVSHLQNIILIIKKEPLYKLSNNTELIKRMNKNFCQKV